MKNKVTVLPSVLISDEFLQIGWYSDERHKHDRTGRGVISGEFKFIEQIEPEDCPAAFVPAYVYVGLNYNCGISKDETTDRPTLVKSVPELLAEVRSMDTHVDTH